MLIVEASSGGGGGPLGRVTIVYFFVVHVFLELRPSSIGIIGCWVVANPPPMIRGVGNFQTAQFSVIPPYCPRVVFFGLHSLVVPPPILSVLELWSWERLVGQ